MFELEFVECDECRSKCGSPELCGGCLANRHTISVANRRINELTLDLNRCKVSCIGCGFDIDIKLTTKLSSGERICTNCIEGAKTTELHNSLTGE